MLVVISDLHFVDGTAGEQDVPWVDFDEIFKCDLKPLAEINNAKELKVLLLGDVLDLLRTAKWLEIDGDDRPWGRNGLKDIEGLDRQNGSVTENCCREILHAIIKRNYRTFQTLRGLKKTFSNIPVQLIYVPGNHDRLVNVYPRIRKTVSKILGLTINDSTVAGLQGNDWHFLNSFEDKKYGVFARHGHEYDYLNYERSHKDRLDEYCRVPIGDVLTTEFAVQIGVSLLPKVEELALDDREGVRQAIYGIDNIRPWTSIPGYLVKKFRHNAVMWKAVKHAFYKACRNIMRIRFARRWFVKHRIRVIADLWNYVVGALAPRILDAFSRDVYATAASKDYVERQKVFPFILYGHTHSPKQIPLDIVEDIAPCYINTGTWRSRIELALRRNEYVGFKAVTYAVFYNCDERPEVHKKPSQPFEVWTGCRNII